MCPGRIKSSLVICLLGLTGCGRKPKPPTIFDAARSGDTALVSAFLARGIPVDAKDPEGGSTPLEIAAGNGRLGTTRLLLEKGADPNAVSKSSWTPLAVATFHGYADIAKLLLASGAKADPILDDGSRPLNWTSFAGHLDAAQLLLDHGADVDAMDHIGHTALMEAAANGVPDRETATPSGTVTLVGGPGEGNDALVRLLLDRGAKVDARSRADETALMYAAGKCRGRIVALLLSRGADVNAKSKYGQTPLWNACYRCGSVPIVQTLLDHGADIEASEVASAGGWTPLMAAARSGYADVVRLLIARGAKTDARDDHGLTAADVACKSRDGPIRQCPKSAIIAALNAQRKDKPQDSYWK